MGRQSRIIGISLPPELVEQLDQLGKRSHRNRSEVLRDMIINSKRPDYLIKDKDARLASTAADILRSYWQLRLEQKKTIKIIGLALIVKDHKILIVKRRGQDPHVEHLQWAFPGGQIETLDFSQQLKTTIKQKLALNIITSDLISARIYPDTTDEHIQIVTLYFNCKIIDGKIKLDDQAYKEHLWVDPSEIYRYFSTSTSDEVTTYLFSI